VERRLVVPGLQEQVADWRLQLPAEHLAALFGRPSSEEGFFHFLSLRVGMTDWNSQFGRKAFHRNGLLRRVVPLGSCFSTTLEETLSQSEAITGTKRPALSEYSEKPASSAHVNSITEPSSNSDLMAHSQFRAGIRNDPQYTGFRWE
jgi:hypothetical protein